MKIFLLCFAAFVCACSTQNRIKEVREAMLMQYSHGFYFYQDSETEKLGEEYTKVVPERAARGANIYKASCVKCHGNKAEGTGRSALREQPPANIARMVKDRPYFRFNFNQQRWNERMPGWKMSLTPEQVEDLRHYILSIVSE